MNKRLLVRTQAVEFHSLDGSTKPSLLGTVLVPISSFTVEAGSKTVAPVLETERSSLPSRLSMLEDATTRFNSLLYGAASSGPVNEY
jgi:hypothetical protein